MKNRNHYFDFLRGIAILMVVGIHTYTMSNFDSVEGIRNIIIRESLNFAVPLFLAISGFIPWQERFKYQK
jgi:surface polysaccharide O-acyltransferase-like enzyme